MRRAGKKEEAAKALERVPPDMKSNEGHTVLYYNLVRLFQGLKTEEQIAQGKVWVTWGFVGAETELARMKK